MSSREGFGKGRIDPTYQGVDNGIPLLSTFYFRFEQEEDSSQGVDNHINSIRIMPAGQAVDLSPTAGLPLDIVESGKISLMYRDKDADDAKDRYFYKVAHSIQPSHVQRFQIRDIGCQGRCERTLPLPPGFPDTAGVFVLVGFQLFYTGSRDHHADAFGIEEENGKLTVWLNDKNDDDGFNDAGVFSYIIDYALVSPIAQNIQLGEEAGTAKGGARVELPQGIKVIRGFSFDYSEGDHHLREIGVLTSDRNLEVFYGDKNGDDEFTWRVRWAKIGPLVNELGTP